MRAEFYRSEAAGEVVGSAVWDGSPRVRVDPASGENREVLGRVFRPTPVSIDDPSLRSFGTSGPVLLPPGSLRWFQAAARVRGQTEGLSVRFVDQEQGAMGWDPAGAYRSFPEAIERKVRTGGPRQEQQPGEARPGAEPSQPAASAP